MDSKVQYQCKCCHEIYDRRDENEVLEECKVLFPNLAPEDRVTVCEPAVNEAESKTAVSWGSGVRPAPPVPPEPKNQLAVKE